MTDNHDNQSNQHKSEDNEQAGKSLVRLPISKLLDMFRVKHDNFFKYVFSMLIFATVFTRALFKRRFPNFLDLLDIEHLHIQTVPLKDNVYHEYLPDLVYYIPFKGENYGIQLRVILEHKSYRDRMTVFQTARYVFHSLSEEFSQIQKKEKTDKLFYFSPTFGVIINQAGSKYTGPSRLEELYHKIKISKEKDSPELQGELEKLRKACLNMEPLILDLNDPDPSTLLSDKDSPELLYILQIMQSIHTPVVKQLTMDVLSGLKPYSEKYYYKILADAIMAYVISNSSHIEEEEISLFCNAWNPFNRKGEDEMATIFEKMKKKYKVEGKVEGIEEGKKEGIIEGKIEGKKESIISLLENRFQSVPEEIQEKIRSQKSREVVEMLFTKAIKCENLNDFSREL